MEMDEDIDAVLLRQFNCMGTTDKEVLIKELQGLVGAHLNEHSAKFYLEMTDWNLQAAVCAYFDLQSYNKLPQMTFVKDVTIGEGESVPPSTRFIKTWRIQNTGEDGWPIGCSLIFTGGEQLGAPSHVSVGPLGAGECADVSVEMLSPAEPGLYSSKWRMSTSQGNFFGDTIWVIVPVDSGGTLALMQQMVNFKALGSPPSGTHMVPANTMSNPFAPLHLGQQPDKPQQSEQDLQQQQQQEQQQQQQDLHQHVQQQQHLQQQQEQQQQEQQQQEQQQQQQQQQEQQQLNGNFPNRSQLLTNDLATCRVPTPNSHLDGDGDIAMS